jgi:hypothetical protein
MSEYLDEYEFTPWPKIARLNRDIVVTEKIDGTNAAVGVDDELNVWSQSRTRVINPKQDNHGFARWVSDNAAALATTLGPGLHFGEWWGSGIQRGYGLPKGEKRFSLFNTSRWADLDTDIPSLGVVPVLYAGPFSEDEIRTALRDLKWYGSQAAYDFMSPEGVVVFHTASNSMFKVTIEGDEKPKGQK